jgi:hypothetical protein
MAAGLATDEQNMFSSGEPSKLSWLSSSDDDDNYPTSRHIRAKDGYGSST